MHVFESVHEISDVFRVLLIGFVLGSVRVCKLVSSCVEASRWMEPAMMFLVGALLLMELWLYFWYIAFDAECFNPFLVFPLGCFLAYSVLFNFYNTKVNAYLNFTSFSSKNIESINSVICYKCHLPKPERAHHCAVCNKCVLRMDHHCAAIGCCIGALNHRFFINFLLWAFVSVSSICVLGNGVFFGVLAEARMQVNGGFAIAVKMYKFSFCIAFVLLFFTAFTLFLAFRGQTTIELIISESPRRPSNVLENFEQIYGSRSKIHLWFLPVHLQQNRYNGIHVQLGEGPLV